MEDHAAILQRLLQLPDIHCGKSSVSAAAVPAACPVTAQQGITRMISHMASVTEVHRPAMIRFFTLAEYSVENGTS